MRFLGILAGLAWIMVAAMPAQAVPVTWQANGTFQDGATLSGSFVFDASTDNYSNIGLDITGGVFDGVHLSLFHPLALLNGFPPSQAFFVLETGTDPLHATGSHGMAFIFAQPLTDVGGIVDIFLGHAALSADELATLPAPPDVMLASGTVMSAPEPGTMLLMCAGLFGAAALRRRQARDRIT